jgi:hypothetical protein
MGKSSRRSACAPRLLAVDFGTPFGTELFKLHVKSLAAGAESEAAVLWVTFGHTFCKS